MYLTSMSLSGCQMHAINVAAENYSVLFLYIDYDDSFIAIKALDSNIVIFSLQSLKLIKYTINFT